MGYTDDFQGHFIASRSWEFFLLLKIKVVIHGAYVCQVSVFSLQTENLPWNTDWSPGWIPVSNLN